MVCGRETWEDTGWRAAAASPALPERTTAPSLPARTRTGTSGRPNDPTSKNSSIKAAGPPGKSGDGGVRGHEWRRKPIRSHPMSVEAPGGPPGSPNAGGRQPQPHAQFATRGGHPAPPCPGRRPRALEEPFRCLRWVAVPAPPEDGCANLRSTFCGYDHAQSKERALSLDPDAPGAQRSGSDCPQGTLWGSENPQPHRRSGQSPGPGTRVGSSPLCPLQGAATLTQSERRAALGLPGALGPAMPLLRLLTGAEMTPPTPRSGV